MWIPSNSGLFDSIPHLMSQGTGSPTSKTSCFFMHSCLQSVHSSKTLEKLETSQTSTSGLKICLLDYFRIMGPKIPNPIFIQVTRISKILEPTDELTAISACPGDRGSCSIIFN